MVFDSLAVFLCVKNRFSRDMEQFFAFYSSFYVIPYLEFGVNIYYPYQSI